MIRFVLYLLGGLALGGIIHVVTVLGVPHFAERDAWARVAAFGPDGRFNAIPRVAPGVKPLPGIDPAMAHAVCRFSLAKAPVRIKAELPDNYWSIALYDRAGLVVYSLNDRAAEQKPIDVLIATAEQIAQLRENPPEDFENIVIVDWPDRDGFAMLKAFVPTPSLRPEIEAALGTASCQAAPIAP
ncbi:hypothetical protein [Methyloraptor flagellatus]|uniref:DUF1254 domain-containing protein n=1 Tax=Methyloraptor flagellatus TaxID=3162530 RepID=A0AAU7X4W1_9HYPH